SSAPSAPPPMSSGSLLLPSSPPADPSIAPSGAPNGDWMPPSGAPKDGGGAGGRPDSAFRVSALRSMRPESSLDAPEEGEEGASAGRPSASLVSIASENSTEFSLRSPVNLLPPSCPRDDMAWGEEGALVCTSSPPAAANRSRPLRASRFTAARRCSLG